MKLKSKLGSALRDKPCSKEALPHVARKKGRVAYSLSIGDCGEEPWDIIVRTWADRLSFLFLATSLSCDPVPAELPASSQSVPQSAQVVVILCKSEHPCSLLKSHWKYQALGTWLEFNPGWLGFEASIDTYCLCP